METLAWLPFPVLSFWALACVLLSVFSAAKLADDVFGEGDVAKKLGTFFRNSLGTPSFARAYVGAAFLVERIYGPRILSLRALCVSVVSTCAWLGLLVGCSVVLYGKRTWIFNAVFVDQVMVHFWVFLFFGVLADYVAASVARYLFSLALAHGSLIKVLCLAAVVAFSGLAFFLIYGQAKHLVLSEPLPGNFDTVKGWLSFPLELHLTFMTLNDWRLTPDGQSGFRIQNGNAEVIYAFPEGMLFLSSLLTSVWLLAHVLSHWLYAMGMRVSAFSRFLVRESSLEKRPLQSAATITGLLALLPAWLIAMVLHYLS